MVAARRRRPVGGARRVRREHLDVVLGRRLRGAPRVVDRLLAVRGHLDDDADRVALGADLELVPAGDAVRPLGDRLPPRVHGVHPDRVRREEGGRRRPRVRRRQRDLHARERRPLRPAVLVERARAELVRRRVLGLHQVVVLEVVAEGGLADRRVEAALDLVLGDRLAVVARRGEVDGDHLLPQVDDVRRRLGRLRLHRVGGQRRLVAPRADAVLVLRAHRHRVARARHDADHQVLQRVGRERVRLAVDAEVVRVDRLAVVVGLGPHDVDRRRRLHAGDAAAEDGRGRLVGRPRRLHVGERRPRPGAERVVRAHLHRVLRRAGERGEARKVVGERHVRRVADAVVLRARAGRDDAQLDLVLENVLAVRRRRRPAQVDVRVGERRDARLPRHAGHRADRREARGHRVRAGALRVARRVLEVVGGGGREAVHDGARPEEREVLAERDVREDDVDGGRVARADGGEAREVRVDVGDVPELVRRRHQPVDARRRGGHQAHRRVRRHRRHERHVGRRAVRLPQRPVRPPRLAKLAVAVVRAHGVRVLDVGDELLVRVRARGARPRRDLAPRRRVVGEAAVGRLVEVVRLAERRHRVAFALARRRDRVLRARGRAVGAPVLDLVDRDRQPVVDGRRPVDGDQAPLLAADAHRRRVEVDDRVGHVVVRPEDAPVVLRRAERIQVVVRIIARLAAAVVPGAIEERRRRALAPTPLLRTRVGETDPAVRTGGDARGAFVEGRHIVLALRLRAAALVEVRVPRSVGIFAGAAVAVRACLYQVVGLVAERAGVFGGDARVAERLASRVARGHLEEVRRVRRELREVRVGGRHRGGGALCPERPAVLHARVRRRVGVDRELRDGEAVVVRREPADLEDIALRLLHQLEVVRRVGLALDAFHRHRLWRCNTPAIGLSVAFRR